MRESMKLLCYRKFTKFRICSSSMGKHLRTVRLDGARKIALTIYTLLRQLGSIIKFRFNVISWYFDLTQSGEATYQVASIFHLTGLGQRGCTWIASTTENCAHFIGLVCDVHFRGFIIGLYSVQKLLPVLSVFFNLNLLTVKCQSGLLVQMLHGRSRLREKLLFVSDGQAWVVLV